MSFIFFGFKALFIVAIVAFLVWLFIWGGLWLYALALQTIISAWEFVLQSNTDWARFRTKMKESKTKKV